MADGCKFPGHELREEHKCRSCEKLLHVLCAERSDPQDDRVIYCGTCDLADNQRDTELELALDARRKRRKLNKRLWELAQQPRRGIRNTIESSDEEETETEPEDDNDDNQKTVVSENDSCIAEKTVATTAAIVPQEITENRTMSNCLISTITQSVDGKTRFIPKDYFLKFDQRVNMEYKTKDKKKWLNMRNEIEKEINQDIILRMVRRAQQVGLYFLDENTGEKKLVTSIKEIGTAYSNDDSEECATKVYACLNQDFPIRSGYERSIESVIMNRLNIKYTDPDTTAKSVTKQKKKVLQNKSCSKAKAVENDQKTPSKTATKKIITRKSNSKIQRNETCDNTKRKKVTSKCPYDHTHYSYAYHEEWNCKYFAQNGALYDVRCNECQKLITDEEKEGSVMSTMCRPVFVCGGRNHYETFAVVVTIIYKKLL